MNWKKKYDKPMVGDKVKVIKCKVDESRYTLHQQYNVGEIFTLKNNYIINGVWIRNNEPAYCCDTDVDYWDTEEGRCICSKEFILV